MRNSTILSCLVLLLAPAIGWSQEFRSTLSGRVVDAQTAVVPGVKISATQVETGARHETLSGADGLYTLPFLPPGSYQITAEAPGFKRYVREGIRVNANERLPLDITLEVGQVTEQVTVSAEASLLETVTASSGQVISTRQIENMPLNGRTPLMLAQLAFGVIPVTDPRFSRPFDNSGPSTFTMGGAPARSNDLLLDGAPDTTRNSRVAYNAPVDSVEEVKVETFQVDAAYGHSGGGTVNIVTKGGTNSLHGAAYDFNQVSRLAANQFFNNRARQPKPLTRFNQWGINSGGPVVIPKLFNGHNKLFFYFAYEGIRDALPAPVQSTVPTPDERNGDFSQLLPVGSSYQIYDPLTGVREGTRIRRQPFQNNILPPSRISSIAKNYLPLFPQPNQPSRGDGRDNLIIGRSGERNFFHNEIGRLDLVLSERHKLFYNARHNERAEKDIDELGHFVEDVSGNNLFKRENWGSTVDDVYTFTPTTVLNTRIAWSRFIEGDIPVRPPFDPATFGFPASLSAASPRVVMPAIEFSTFHGVGDTGGDETRHAIFQIFSSLTKIVGKHSLKMGTDLRLYQESSVDFGYSAGQYSFGTNWTRGPLDNSTSAPGGLGQDLASFLLGLPTGGGFDVNASRVNQAGYYALFLHDDYRVRPDLTLNLGIRWEHEGPTRERFNRSVNGFDFTTPNPIDAQARAAYARNPIPEVPVGQFRAVGGLLFAGPGNRDLYRTQSHYFNPRFGFAWTPKALGSRTVIRGGAGVFFFPIGTIGVNQVGFSQRTSLVASLDGFLTPSATFSNPFPGGIEKPTGSSLGLATFLGKSFSFYNTSPLNPYSIRWDLNIQREVMKNLVLEVGYMGNHAVHLTFDRQLDFVPRSFFSTSPRRDQPVIDRLTSNVTNPFEGLAPGTSLNGSTVSVQQLLRPFPEFTGVRAQARNDGSSYFHMLQVRVEKRYSMGLQFLGNYQYSKMIERRSLLNDFDTVPEKRVSDDDRPQRFVLSGSYELPFGRGKPLGASAGPLLRRAIGGWIVSAIYTWQPGQVLGWGNVIYLGGDLNINPRNVDGAFDTTRFNTSSREQLDSNVRTFPSRFGNLRQDATNNMDYSVLKDTGITEKLKLQYRCEFFNGLNHATFDAPRLSPTASNFGKITRTTNVARRIQMALRLVW